MKKILTLFFMVSVIYAHSQVDLENGLVAFYPLCGNINDYSMNNNDGFAIGGDGFVADRVGNSNSSYLFDGKINSYLNIPNTSELENIKEELSISLWFNTNFFNLPENLRAPLLIKSENLDSSPPNRHFALYYDFLDRLYFNDNVILVYPFELDIWYHITITYSDSRISCYINGVLEGTKEGIAVNPNQSPLEIGRDTAYYEAYNGTLDDIRIYNRVLTMDEITLLSIDSYQCNTTSTKDLLLKESPIISPNPFQHFIKIQLPYMASELLIRILNTNGELVSNNSFYSVKEVILSTSELDSGIYFISIISQDKKITKKIIKINR